MKVPKVYKQIFGGIRGKPLSLGEKVPIDRGFMQCLTEGKSVVCGQGCLEFGCIR